MEMLTAETISTGQKPPTAAPPARGPVALKRKSLLKLAGEILDHGGPGYLQFAITNICNAKCDFCGFARDKFDPRQRRSVSLERGAECHRHLRPKPHRLPSFRRRRTARPHGPARDDPLRRRARHPPDGLHQRLALDRTATCATRRPGLEQRHHVGGRARRGAAREEPRLAGCLPENPARQRSVRRTGRANHRQRHRQPADRRLPETSRFFALARLLQLHLQLPADQSGLQLPELQRFRAGELQDGGVDRSL